MNTTARRKKIATTVTLMSAVAVTALVGGTLAQITDSDTTTEQVLKAGTVEINLIEGAVWNTNLTNLGVGDTVDRTVLVDNTSTLDIGSMRLTADLTDTPGDFGGRLSEAVTVDITQDHSTVLANDVRLTDLTDGYNLAFPDGILPAGTDVDLDFHYEVVGAPTIDSGDRTKGKREMPDNPDNKYQGSALSVAYTIDAIQRTGTGDAASEEPAPVSVGSIVGWGFNSYGQSVSPVGLTDVTEVDGGYQHTIALRTDGTLVGWGYDAYGQATVPIGLVDVIDVAAKENHTVAARSDGTVVAWGYNGSGESNVPAGLDDVVQVSAGAYHNLARRSNGTVVAWGKNDYLQTRVPAGLVGVTDIAAGGWHNLAIRSDGTVAAWGRSEYGQIAVPSGLIDVVQVAAGNHHSLALKADGTVVGWGTSTAGQVPVGLTDVVAIAADGNHSLALKSDGSVVAWGQDSEGQATVPAGLSDVVRIGAGSRHSLAIIKSS